MTYNCPVCGYDELRQPPVNHMICPCCGTQFGYDDYARSHPSLRRSWLEGGCRWYSRRTPMPEGWSLSCARDQMIRAGLVQAISTFEGLPELKAEVYVSPIAACGAAQIYKPLAARNMTNAKAIRKTAAGVSVTPYRKAA